MVQAVSRESLAAARERFDERVGGLAADVLGELAGQLTAVAELLVVRPEVRRALADASAPEAARQGLLDRLLGDRLDQPALGALRDLVAARWSRPDDLVDAVEALARLAALAIAERDESIEDVEDELFRFGRILDGQPRLRRLLADPVAPADRRVELLRSLVSGKVGPVTERLLEQAVRMPRGRSLDVVAEELAELAAARRDRSVAHVIAPGPLTQAQEQRLARALSGIYGRKMSLQVDVEPELLGGLVVRVGDEVVDGSVSARLERARQRLAGG